MDWRLSLIHIYATGLYYKVVDSDDWLDIDSLQKLLTRLRTLIQQDLARCV